jgi:glucose-1-phosphate thymidylyltransferase
MRGVILAGGRGTRLAPQTEITNKHLLPVYTPQGAIPMIWYPLNTLVQSGVKDILIISSQEHCGDITQFLGDGKRFGVELTYKIQDHNDTARPVGIASAMKLIDGWIKDEPFAVILGDNFYEDSFGEIFSRFAEMYQDIRHFIGGPRAAHIFLKEVPDPERFGVATIKDDRVTKIEEKPKNPESNCAVTGLYLFTPHVFEIIRTLKPSARGELEVSDINDFYVQDNSMTSTITNGYWSDMGIPSSMARTQEWINTNNYRIPFK